ncbi:MEDS domain-containing protein [Streptomyces purpurogeneiscleroticus]|uniref:MEDS domain-containing protein n=1 Tax=Streptomyces purpurogeneiscleroticus TaxID=68259 RepID=UPI001CBDD164|nr:MEDS domain-containing protein [Streptomyces purpurogeneiscleroticus]
MAGEAMRRGTLPVQRLRPGDHAFCRYTERTRWDLVAAYAWTGLARGEKVIICAPPQADRDTVQERLEEHGPSLDHVCARGQLVITGMRMLLHPDGRFTPARLRQRIQEEIAGALAKRCAGLRTYIDMRWIADLGADVEEVMAREESAAPLFAARSYSEVCAYDTSVFEPAVLDAMHAAHPHDLLDGPGALRALHAAGSVRLIGEADMATRIEWTSALRDAFKRSAHDGHLVVDLSRLHFLSVGCASDLLNLSTDAHRHGRIEVRLDRGKATLLIGLGSRYLKHVVLVEDS